MSIQSINPVTGQVFESDDLVTAIHEEGSPVETRLDRLTRRGDIHTRPGAPDRRLDRTWI